MPIPMRISNGLCVRMGMPRRVKNSRNELEVQKFRKYHFSFSIVQKGLKFYIWLQNCTAKKSIGSDPLPPGSSLDISPGDRMTYWTVSDEVNEGIGWDSASLMCPAPVHFAKVSRVGEQKSIRHAENWWEIVNHANWINIQLWLLTPP